MISQLRSTRCLCLAAVLLVGFAARLAGAPANDDFAAAQRLTGPSGVVTVSLAGATLDPTETVWPGTRRSVWFTWTAPGTGTLLFTVAGSATPSASAFFLKTNSVGRPEIQASTASEERQRVPVEAGRTYWWSVMDRFGTADEALLSFQWFAPPANDAVGSATPLPADGSPIVGSAAGATLDDIELKAGIGEVIWYRWTAPTAGRAYPELELPDVIPPVVFRSGVPSVFTRIWDSGDGVEVQAGESLQISVGAHHEAFRLRVRLETAHLVVTPGSPFAADTPWSVRAETTPWDGEIREVEFQVDDSDRIVDATSPFSLESPGLAAGAHTVRASVILRDGSIRPVPPVPLQILPANDRFESAAELTGERDDDQTDLRFATADPGEPAHGALRAQRTGWWQWTAPRSGGVELIADFASGSTLSVYTGDRLEALNPIRTGDSALLTFTAEAGLTYRFVINVRDADHLPGDVSLRLRMAAPVPNDRFVDALPVTGTSVVLRADTEVATSEPGERVSLFGTRTVWWRWTAPDDGFLTVQGIPDSRWVEADIYEGETLTTLVRQSGPWDDTRNVRVRSGVTYRIQARAWDEKEVEMALRFVPAAAHDDFQAALELKGLPVSASGDLENATLESTEPPTPGRSVWRSLWYRWTAETSGWVSIASTHWIPTELQVPETGVRVTLFRGTQLSTLTPIGIASLQRQSGLGFEATAGETYFIQVGDMTSRSGVAPFEFVLDGVPANDDVATPAELPPAGGAISGSMILSTPDSETPAPTTDAEWGSVWYRWIPATSGWATVTVTSPDTVRTRFFSRGTVGQDLQPLPVAPAFRQDRTTFHQVPIVAGQELIVGLFEGAWQGRVQGGSRFDLEVWPSRLALLPAADAIVRTYGDSLPLEVAGEPAQETSLLLVQDGRPVVTSTNLTQPPFLHTLSNLASGVFTAVGVARLTDGRIVATAPTPVRVAPAHDAFNDAVPIADLPLRGSGELAGASFESGETAPSDPSSGSLWWRWKPGRGGLVTLTGNVALDIFRGDALLNLVPLATLGTPPPSTFEVEAGVEYRLRVTRPMGPVPAGSLPFEFILAWVPPNDAFEAATTVSGMHVHLVADLEGATAQPGEPGSAPYFPQQTAWFRWTVPGDGWLWMVCDTSEDRFAASVFSGSRRDQLVRLTSGLVEWGPLHAPVRAGSDLAISLDALSYDPVPPVQWTLRWFASPTNDAFASAQRLEGLNPEIFGINFGATREPGEPERRTAPASRLIDRTVWFRWTAPASGRVRLENQNATPPDHPQRESVFFEPFAGDSLETLVSLWPNGLSLEPARWLDFPVEAGRTYSFLVGDESPLDRPFHLAMRGPVPPSNDAFLQAQPLAADATELKGTLWNASREPGEPSDPTNPGLRTVWYRWTAPARGVLHLYDSMIQFMLWQGQTLDSLVPVESPWQSGRFRTEAGRSYWIQVASNGDYDFTVPLEFGVSPSNDDFVNAQQLPPAGGRIQSPVSYSTSEPGEDRTGVWFRWTAPEPGFLTLRSESGHWVDVFRGTDPLNLTLQTWDSGSTLRYRVLGGETYHVHVSERAALPVELVVDFTPRLLPALTGGSWSGDRFRLSLPDAPGTWVDLQTSPDLRAWFPAGTHWILPSAGGNFLELPGAGASGFFRFTPR